MQPTLNNTRYVLELERNALLEKKYEFDEKYGTFSFAFLASLEAFALFVYLYIATVLIYYRKSRTKTNFIVSVWALINFAVLLEKLSREFSLLIGDDFLISENGTHLTEMISGLARCYGAALSIIWLFTRYVGSPKCNVFMYFLMSVPALTYVFYVCYYFMFNKFIYEVYAPALDVISVVVYLTVGLIFLLCKIFVSDSAKPSQYALMISIVNLIANFPSSLMKIYIRFNLDISWTYRFHIYFVDLFMDAFQCSGAFMVLFIIILYNSNVRNSILGIPRKVEEVMTIKV